MWECNGVDQLDLLLHPIRLRIVHAMSGDRVRTTTDLCRQLPDVPKTSVYRHVGLLADGGILEVVEEQRVHGAVERHYRLRRGGAVIDRETALAMTLDDHRRGFTGAMASLLAEFNAYLDREDADPPADSVGYKQGVLWVDPAEMEELALEVVEVFRRRAANGPGGARRPYLTSLIMFPTEPAHPDGSAGG
ncbi:helix-turn-helix protein [Kutzneria buriramensis]|uniref:Helix-turn-helix protein n=1 Tax=Kutzneria buriramensis TaxID=1045776 RepID=A0A3E0GYV3_9PSEU|nr:helix-turn-helix protein [Kutzneria buriramensis]